MIEEEETTWENYDDIFEVKDEISDWKPSLLSESEKITQACDSSDKASVTWQKMEVGEEILNSIRFDYAKLTLKYSVLILKKTPYKKTTNFICILLGI